MKRFSNSILVIFFLFFLFLQISLRVNALGNVEWILVKENQLGKEWLDLGSLKKINENEISVLTRYYENPSEGKDKGETFLYVMRINCPYKEFKDISKNGIPNFNPKWDKGNGDELIESVISKSCSEFLN